MFNYTSPSNSIIKVVVRVEIAFLSLPIKMKKFTTMVLISKMTPFQGYSDTRGIPLREFY